MNMCRKLVKTLSIINLNVLLLFNITATDCFANTTDNNNTTNYSLINTKRAFVRIAKSELQHPITIKSNDTILVVKDISRGGLGIENNNRYNIGDVIPTKIQYRDIEVNTNIKIIRKDSNYLGAEFVNNNSTANKLMYLSIKLEADSGKLITRFSDGGIL